VQHRSHEGGQVGDSAAGGEQRGDLDGMIDIGRWGDVLTPLTAVFVGGKLQGRKKMGQVGNEASGS